MNIERKLSVLSKFIILFSCVWFNLGLAQGPTIDVWYGNNQKFGNIGVAQRWLNILGNVSDPDGIKSLSYTLNGGASNDLNIGPDGERLQNAGDFNIELSASGTPDGANQVIITATDSLDNVSRDTVNITYTTGNLWPTSYSISWNSVTNIQDVAQIVDGYWTIDNNKLRTFQPGYDRIVAIGDTTWTEEYITMPVTINNSSGESNAAIGFILRWKGHRDRDNGSQPVDGLAWGAIAWGKPNKSELYIIDESFNGPVKSYTLETGTTYIFKAGMVNVSSTVADYKLKVWQQGTSEPVDWDLEYTVVNGQVAGSIGLVAHYVDVSIGDIVINPTDTSLPVELSIFSLAIEDNSIAISWRTESEIENMGFNLYRKSNRNSNYQKINTKIIEGAGNSSYAHNYKFIDKDVIPGLTYQYKLESVDFNGQTEIHGPIEIYFNPAQVSSDYILFENYPNPFNNSTIIRFKLPEAEMVLLNVYNSLGQKIKTLLNDYQPPGIHNVFWDGTDDSGNIVSSGIYYYSLETPRYVRMKKMLFLQ